MDSIDIAGSELLSHTSPPEQSQHEVQVDKLQAKILEKMREDEAKHQASALDQGGLDFPYPLKKLMKIASRVMTRSTYWI